MSFCEKCGAYIPMDDTACPACGYDPEQAEKERQQQEEERRQREQKESRERYEYAGAQQQEYAYGTAQNQQHSTYEQSRQEKKTSGTGTAGKDWQWTGGQRPLWEDPNKTRTNANYEDYAKKAREWAADSVSSRYLSILSYIGPLFLVPLFLRKGDSFAKHHANQGLTLFLFSALLSLIEEFVVFGGLIRGVGSIFVLFCMVKGILSVINGRMDKLPLLGDIRLLK